MSQLKVLSILHSFFNRAGTELHAKLLANALQSDVETLFLVANKGAIQLLTKEGNIQENFFVPPLAFPSTELSHPEYELIFENVLASVKPDIVHVHHLMNWPVGILSVLERKNIPWVLSLHDYFLITPHYTMQGATDPKITVHPNYAQKIFGADISGYLKERRELLQKLLGSAANIIAPSKYMKRIFQAIFSYEVSLIEHGVEASDPLNSGATENAFGFIGSFLPQKGLTTLLEAFNLYKTHGGGWKLHLFGGTLDVLPDQVVVHGVYDQKDLDHIGKHFTIGIIPSVFPETYCLTLSEMWQSGKPVIASSIGALRERIGKNPGAGWLVPAGSAKALAEAMLLGEQLMTDGSLTVTIPVVPTAKQMADHYLDVYQKIKK